MAGLDLAHESPSHTRFCGERLLRKFALRSQPLEVPGQGAFCRCRNGLCHSKIVRFQKCARLSGTHRKSGRLYAVGGTSCALSAKHGWPFNNYRNRCDTRIDKGIGGVTGRAPSHPKACHRDRPAIGGVWQACVRAGRRGNRHDPGSLVG